ncbi:thiazolylpeptide-type bacteriocin [Streptomyces sp. NPDC093801]|uniref:thiazolylpeptide-type bacteriocin n=1 Tax=unclassified Streptomyces TaxID=2593676 RepID=UPI00344C68E1
MADFDAATLFEAHDLDLGDITVTSMRDTADVSAFAKSCSTATCGIPTACACHGSMQQVQTVPGVV